MPHADARNHRDRNRPLLIAELAVLIALTVADLAGLVPLSRTPFLLLLGWISLRLRRLGWRDVGLRRPARFPRAIVAAIAAGLAIELLAIHVTIPLIGALTGSPPDVSDFRALVGNLPLLLILLAVSWILAAFGEELAFRGYLMSRAAGVFGTGGAGWAVSLVLVSAFFGIGHGTQGVSGIVQEALSGAWLGILYLATGRNLVAPIVAHGVSNTLALILIYLHCYPGLP